MPTVWSPDLEFVFSLAAVFWLHGWRRSSGDVLLAAQAPFTNWRAKDPFGRLGPFILTTWWPAFLLSIVVPPADRQAVATWQSDFAVEVARGRRRVQRVRALVLVLRISATAFILWIVVGVPLAVARYGATGLVASLLAAVPMLVFTGACTYLAMRLLGTRARKALVTALRHCGPFTAPFAAEAVVEQALTGLEAAARLATVMGDRRFHEWIRPWAYDARHVVADGAGRWQAATRIARSLPDEVIARAINAVPADDGRFASRFCPRCGGLYRDTATVCSGCEDVVLAPCLATDQH